MSGCCGSRLCSHAAVVTVPENLVVRVDDGTPVKSASAVASGAIDAGVRRADVNWRKCVVIGGFIGNLAAQMLVAAGARVAVVDLNEEPAIFKGSRCGLTVNPKYRCVVCSERGQLGAGLTQCFFQPLRIALTRCHKHFKCAEGESCSLASAGWVDEDVQEGTGFLVSHFLRTGKV